MLCLLSLSLSLSLSLTISLSLCSLHNLLQLDFELEFAYLRFWLGFKHTKKETTKSQHNLDSKSDSDEKKQTWAWCPHHPLTLNQTLTKSTMNFSSDVVNELSLRCFNKSQEYQSLKEMVDSLEANIIAMGMQYEQLRVKNNFLQNLNDIVMKENLTLRNLLEQNVFNNKP